MNHRRRRLVFMVVAMGVVMLLGLGVLYWSTVRDHVEAWCFQLTRATVTIEANPGLAGLNATNSLGEDRAGLLGSPIYAYDLHTCLSALADYRGLPLVLDREESVFLAGGQDHPLFLMSGRRWTVDMAGELILKVGYRVLEQQLPRKAYILIRDPPASRARSPSEQRPQ